jgi:glycosyltransferase involved in cell wall biosynthesis
VRLLALASGLRAAGVAADILAPVPRSARLEGVPVLPLLALRGRPAYDLVKTCYHQAIFRAEGFQGPLVARLVRVVDERRPIRDRAQRAGLLQAQRAVSERAQAVAFNNRENLARWQRLYGESLPCVLTPTGCPGRLPPLGPNPFAQGRPAVVYAGSLASPRQVKTLGRVARALEGKAQVHLLGRNKSGLYGRRVELSPLVIDHGEKTPREVWSYLRWASAGLALAVGPEPFDNDSSKALHYMRAGLPLVCEAPILQGPLAVELGLGRVCPYGDADGLAQTLNGLLRDPPGPGRRRAARAYMARRHGWGNTVRTYIELFTRLLAEGTRR